MDTFSVVLLIVIFYSLLYIVDSLLRCLNFSPTLIVGVRGMDALKAPQFLPVQDMATSSLPCRPSVPGNTDIPWPGAHEHFSFFFSFISFLGEMDNWLFTSLLSGWCASVLHEKVLLKNLISFATHLQGLVQCRILAVLSPVPSLSTFPGLSALSTTPPSAARGLLWNWDGSLAKAISSRWTRLSSDLYFQVLTCLQGGYWLDSSPL